MQPLMADIVRTAAMHVAVTGQFAHGACSKATWVVHAAYTTARFVAALAVAAPTLLQQNTFKCFYTSYACMATSLT
jgi:hypothetical protein